MLVHLDDMEARKHIVLSVFWQAKWLITILGGTIL